MRLQVLVLFLIAVASKCEEEKNANELYDMAEEHAAPFTMDSAYRLGIFGQMVTLRTFDVIVINNSTVPFKLSSNGTYCDGRSSVFTDQLFPEHRLPASSSTYFGLHADRDNDQDFSCYVQYESEDSESEDSESEYSESAFILRVPSSDSEWYSRSSIDIGIYQSQSRREYGDNDEYYPGAVYSQVIYIIRHDPDYHLGMSPKLGGLQVAQRKLKGNRNHFVKASKSGSRVYSM